MAIEDLFKIVKERFVAEQPAVPASQEGDVEIPQDLLFKCPRCGAVVYNREFTAAMKVCPKCSYHARLTWQERLELTADKDSFVELDADMKSLNPIGFPKYEDKIAKMQQQCDMNDAIKTGVCTIRGYRTVIGIMDSHFFMASMGSVVGEKIARAFEYATEHNLPVVMFTASGGARMQEGMVSLMQMAKTTGVIAKLAEHKLPFISVLTDPTMGGVSASFAFMGDVVMAEPKALIGFAGPRVIEQTVREQLPEGFQRSEFLLQKGAIDMIVDRKNLKMEIAKLIALFQKESLDAIE